MPALRQGASLTQWRGSLTAGAGLLASWTGVAPCVGSGPQWQGLTCDDSRTAVVSLNLSGLGLAGPLLGDWTPLQSLQVRLAGDALPAGP
jgi:hypothetical protein